MLGRKARASLTYKNDEYFNDSGRDVLLVGAIGLIPAIMAWKDGWPHQISARMNTLLVIDKAGHVVIPKPLRDELSLAPGDSLKMESAGEQITLHFFSTRRF